MSMWEFDCSEPIDANISIAAGTVSLTTVPTDTIAVSIRKGRDETQPVDDVSVEYSDRHLVVSELPRHGPGWRNKDLHVTITLPPGSRCGIQAASADVSCRGEYAAVDVHTASGRVDVETVHGPAEINAMSGGVQVGTAREATLQTASGRISLRHAGGDVTARTASGNIQIGTADASVTARSASGQIRVLSVLRGSTDVNTVSGDVEVRVAQGTGVYLDLSSVTGRVTSELEPSEPDGDSDLRLHCRTVSGSIRVARATAAQPAS